MIKKVDLVYEGIKKETYEIFKEWLINSTVPYNIKYKRIIITYNEDNRRLVVKIRQINHRMLRKFLTLTQGII